MADLTLPDTAHANDPGHVDDHNMLVAAIVAVNDDVEARDAALDARLDVIETAASHLSPQFTPVGTPTWADEFTGATLDPAWVRVDASGKASYVTWTQASGILSMNHVSGTDPANEIHALLRPIGSTFQPGDALVTHVTFTVDWTTNYAMGSLILTNGTTHGAGAQVFNLDYCDTSSGGMQTSVRSCTNFTTAGSTVDSRRIISPDRTWTRLVMTAANTWRHDVSPDGVSWRIGAATLSYTMTPTHMGFLASNWNAATRYVASYTCLRRYAGVS